MALEPAPPIDVFLSTLDQASPVTAKPVGRLERIVNAVVKKFVNPRAADGTVTHVRVEKRDAFLAIPTTTRTLDGAASTLTGEPQVLFDGGDALREIASNRLFTRAKNWVKASSSADGDTIVFPQTLRGAGVYTADSQAEAPDMAIVGDVACIVWREVALQATSNAGGASTTPVTGDGPRAEFVDAETRAIIRPAFNLNAAPSSTYLKVKVVAHGDRFWVIYDQVIAPGQVQFIVKLFDGNGVAVADTTYNSVPTNNDQWDVTVIPDQGVVIAMPNNGLGIKFVRMTYSGSFTIAASIDTTIKHSVGQPCAWLTDYTLTDDVGHLVTAETTAGVTDIYANKIESLASTHEYPAVATGIATGTTYWISGVTGYVVPAPSTSLVVAYSLMQITGEPEATRYGSGATNGENSQASNNYPNQLNNLVITKTVPFTGSSTTITQRIAMSLASRAFVIGADYVALGYYPACKVGPLSTATAGGAHLPNRPADPSNFQPAWYILPLASKQAIAGRFEYGSAAADWQVLAWDGAAISAGPRNRCLASVPVTASGAMAVPLGYRAEQNIPNAQLFTQNVESPVSVRLLFNTVTLTQTIPTTSTIYQASNTVGVKLFTIGPDCGRAFTANGTTFVPGLMAGVIEQGDPTYTEHGLAAPECPYAVKSATSSTISADGSYFWRAVGEYATQTGKVYRSLPSAPFTYKALVADGKAMDVGVHFIAPTLKKNVKFSLYRTAYTPATVQGSGQVTTPPTASSTTVNGFTSVYYKITNDLRPFYNAPASATGTYTDLLDASTQALGEVLYTDQGYLPRFPAPAFRSGCVWRNRAWLVGYDNAIWFSGEMVEGQGEWFNPGQRVVLPTSEEVTAIAPMEGFLLIFCAGSIWYLPDGAPLPDATGAGTIPAPLRLPFEMGSTGHVAVIRQGCLYSSSTGGVWMITRALANEWVGQDAEEDLSYEISGMTVVGNHVVVATRTGAPMWLVVLDVNLGGWGRWEILTDNQAAVTLVAASGGRTVWADDGRCFQQTPGSYKDGGTDFVPMSGRIAPVHIGGVRNWKRTWAIQLEGQTYDPCSITIGLAYTDRGIDDATYDAQELDAGVLEAEVRPNKQLAASVGISFTDAATDDTVTGQGFALEVASFYVGLEQGLKKGVRRIPKT